MNVTVNTTQLAVELRHLTKISLSKPTIPILGHVLFQAEDQIRLSASNLESAMSTVCKGTIQEMGVATVPAHTLLDFLEQLPDADINILTDGPFVRLASGQFQSKLGALPVKDFPSLPSYAGESATVPAVSFNRLVERTAYAISEKVQQYVLDGALLSLNGEVMAMVSTDAKRLSIATASRPAGPDMSMIVPSKTLEMLQQQTISGDLKIGKTDKHLFFESGPRMLISRMIDGNFPNYQRIIPKDTPYTLQADRAALIGVLKRIGVVAEMVKIECSSSELVCQAATADIGEAEERIAASYEGPDLTFGVRAKALLDFLERAVEPQVTIGMKDNGKPLLLTDGADFVNVIMVIKV